MTISELRDMESFVAKLTEQLTEIESYVSRADRLQPGVSAWSIGQQLEQMLLAMTGIIRGLQFTESHEGSREPNELRDYVFENNGFPRGIVQAPEAAIPSDEATEKSITRLLLKTRNRLGKILEIPVRSTMDHPILDIMTRNESIIFMTIHNDHHLAIVREIVS